MNTKFLIIMALSVIAVVGGVLSIPVLTYDTNLKEEINRLEQEQNQFAEVQTFTGFADMEFLEQWCTTNKGVWKGAKTVNRGECGFETKTQSLIAKANLEDIQRPKVTGYTAQQICDFFGMKCPFNRASFDGWYQLDTGRLIVNYEHKGVIYRFDVTDENNITFKQGDSEGFYILSDKTTLFDEYSIQVKTGYDIYELGEKIPIEGRIRDNNRILSEAVFEYPVTIQILTNGDLVEVAQLDIREDGVFQYIVNTAGHIWSAGEYEIKVNYDTYQATTTFELAK